MFESRTTVALGLAVSGLLAVSALAGARADTPRSAPGAKDGAQRSTLVADGSSMYPFPQCAQPTGTGADAGFAVLNLANGPKGGQIVGSVSVSGGKALAGTTFSVFVGAVKGSSASCKANKDKTLTLDKAGHGTASIKVDAAGPGKYFVFLQNNKSLGSKNLGSQPVDLS